MAWNYGTGVLGRRDLNARLFLKRYPVLSVVAWTRRPMFDFESEEDPFLFLIVTIVE
jgi:hypothetical protein